MHSIRQDEPGAWQLGSVSAPVRNRRGDPARRHLSCKAILGADVCVLGEYGGLQAAMNRSVALQADPPL